MLGVLALYYSCIDERNQAQKLLLATFSVYLLVALDLLALNCSSVICIAISNTNSDTEIVTPFFLSYIFERFLDTPF